MAASLSAYDGITVEEFEAQADAFLAEAEHPTLGRPYRDCAYAPMVELLRYLRGQRVHATTSSPAAAATSCAPIAERLYGIPRERVIGSSRRARAIERDGGVTLTAQAGVDSSTTGRRSRSASGAGSAGGRSSPPATPTATSRCSTFAGSPASPRCACWSLHDDAEREFDYTAGAEQALEHGRARRAGPW